MSFWQQEIIKELERLRKEQAQQHKELMQALKGLK